MAGNYSPQLPNNSKNNNEYKKLCKKVAIIWGNFTPITRDWEKTKREISCNSKRFG